MAKNSRNAGTGSGAETRTRITEPDPAIDVLASKHRDESSTQANLTSEIQVFSAVLPNLVIESILDPDHPNQLRLNTWDGRKAATVPTTSYRGCTYAPSPIAAGLAQAKPSVFPRRVNRSDLHKD